MSSPANSLESDYYLHRNFDPEHATRVRSFYLRFLQECDLIVEAGCGRGEFLELATRAGKRTLGVDRDSGMIEATRDKGLEAVEAEAVEFFRSWDGIAGAVFAAHLVEHLSVDETLELFAAVRERLAPGGRLVIVTPNPKCLAIILSDFWNDPTHVRPYTIPLLEFLAGRAGLEVVESGFNPVDEPGPPPELLAPDTMKPWSVLDFPELPSWDNEQLDVADAEVRSGLHALLQRLYDVNHTLSQQVRVLNDRLNQVRHQVQVTSDSLNKTLRHHYGPNEIYLVARKPA